MIRHAAAVVIVLLLSPSWVTAQGTELTVNVSSASVHKGPSTSSPVIGQAARGAKLQVTRNVGDWVKVAWPSAADGVGYVRVSVGSVSNGTVTSGALASTAPVPNNATTKGAAVPPSQRVVTTPVIVPVESAQPTQTQTGNRLPVHTTSSSSGTTHRFGVGALMGGPALGFGVTARGWSHKRLGVQFDLAHYNVSSPIDLGAMSSTEFGPSVLFSFNDHVADYTWLRPYLGAGMNFYKSSLTSPLLGDMSDSRYGSQMFGGAELSFASVPQFAVSTQLSYRWFNEPRQGYDLGGVGVSLAGHWYVK
jgi:Bacterial SH3 domain